MKNVYDIRYEKNLTYIIAENEDSSTQQLSSEVYLNSAIIIYLYYIDEISKYCQYIDNIPTGIDIFIISSISSKKVIAVTTTASTFSSESSIETISMSAYKDSDLLSIP